MALMRGETSAEAACRIVAKRWGAAILAARATPDRSHGAEVRTRYGAPGAREEAAAGFPTIVLHTLPAFRATRTRGGNRGEAALDGFYAGMAILEDNNLLYRAGPDGLAEAQEMADAFLRAGGIRASGGFARAETLHRHFTARRLSPGGSADLLAATLFLTAFEEAAWA
jgi:triphosphoribosyl-dephospho-CoA synthase